MMPGQHRLVTIGAGAWIKHEDSLDEHLSNLSGQRQRQSASLMLLHLLRSCAHVPSALTCGFGCGRQASKSVEGASRLVVNRAMP